jgi:hypothetical protein
VTSCFVSGIIFELSDQNDQIFFIFIELPLLFIKHIHKMFDEMLVREKMLSWVYL